MPRGALSLTPVAVRGLQGIGTIDMTAFVLGAFVDPAQKLRTQRAIVDRGGEPRWNQTLSLDIQDVHTQLFVEIFDENQSSMDAVAGVPLPLEEVLCAGFLDAWIPMQRADGGSAGELHLTFKFVDQGVPANIDEQQSEMAVEPEGPRATKLRQTFEKSLSKTIKNISYEKLAQSFPHIANDSPESLQSAHQQVTTFLQQSVQEEFQNLLETKNLIRKLNELDMLIDAARKNKQARLGKLVRNSADITPDIAIRARTVPIKQQEFQRLQDELARVRQENKTLMSELVAKKTRLDLVKTTVREISNELSQAVEISRRMPIDDMQHLIDEMVPSLQRGQWGFGEGSVVR
ncbi:Nnf1-domain-containing protein [Jimgerdemannia flammicorona]|uniref:Nnf1-domain-containing protein n=1 Tax=Jimgerdemannia flammicorona TaxID=994334 RepID=A0A433A2T6_9FUNG|nr:Nnf1-domain-containing protein [Jimgerdemannia flammicorona]